MMSLICQRDNPGRMRTHLFEKTAQSLPSSGLVHTLTRCPHRHAHCSSGRISVGLLRSTSTHSIGCSHTGHDLDLSLGIGPPPIDELVELPIHVDLTDINQSHHRLKRTKSSRVGDRL